MVDKARTNQKVDQLIENMPNDEIQNIVAALRNIILESSQELIEEFKWSMPNYSYNGLVCYLQAAKKHVNLGFFNGIELQNKDPEELLQGTAKRMRHIKIMKTEEIQPEAFTSLIQEAVALNKTSK
ncbi:MAG TPA: DUF1801 domain-containing protein [Bacillales bacterium]|nr:DUF1801 domain-containing protein [Bacillales bacterium]